MGNDSRYYISILIKVGDLRAAIEHYVVKTKLFRIDPVSQDGNGPVVILIYDDDAVLFKMKIMESDYVNAFGALVSGGERLKLTLPSSKFERLDVIRDGLYPIWDTPWMEGVTIKDQFGHELTIYSPL